VVRPARRARFNRLHPFLDEIETCGPRNLTGGTNDEE
jgi:hypothetical protein